MNKAYVVSGTYKDLKEKGVLVKEGGVLGLGKKESLQENFKDDNLFTQVDITKTKTIPVNSKSAKLVTEHPANSYKMVKDESIIRPLPILKSKIRLHSGNFRSTQ